MHPGELCIYVIRRRMRYSVSRPVCLDSVRVQRTVALEIPFFSRKVILIPPSMHATFPISVLVYFFMQEKPA